MPERYCAACDRPVTVRYRFDGEPVMWTCEVHGIRDEGEVHSLDQYREVTADA
jgi:hypothetical protein